MFMMFCGMDGARNGAWQDNRRGFEEAFSHFCQASIGVVEGARVRIDGNQPVQRSSCAVFFAKDKSTLVDCLRRCPLSATISATAGQLAFVSHSYDREKIGAWLRTKINGAKTWDQYRQTERGQAFIGRGGSKDTFMKQNDRERLMERGYYLGIANAVDLRQHRDSQAVHADRASLANFGNLVGGRVTREEAVV